VEPLFPIDMAVSPEDVFVALGCTNGTIRIINVKKGTTSHEYRYHRGSVLKLAWHPVHRKL
jgi:WD40 repeat protein